MRKFLLINLSVLILFLIVSPSSRAAGVCTQSLEQLPIQSGGRVKPLGIHAKETLKFISGKIKNLNGSPMEVFCGLSLSAWTGKEAAPSWPSIIVNHVDTMKFLGLPQDGPQKISYKKAREKLPELQSYANALKASGEDSPFLKDLKAVIVRTTLLEEIAQGINWKVPFLHQGSGQEKEWHWIPLTEYVTMSGLVQASPGEIIAKAESLGTQYTETVDSGHLTELSYEKLHLFHWAILFVLLTLAITAVCRKPTHPAVLITLSLTFALEIFALIFRIQISGRAPVTNMYETVMWVGVGGLFFGVLLTYLNREKAFLLGGLSLNLACLFMMSFANDMLDPTIRPLVPVLRDNFWLSTHVTTITISYAAFALSWVLANYYLIRGIFKSNPPALTRRVNKLCYDCLKFGIVLLTLGVILGGIWADYSWGRFWGWDPKETWSLITLMIYIGILHGRYAGWVTLRRFIPLVAASFLSVLMTWFGVNYILAAGLHSYGFSEGGSLFLLATFLIQAIIIALYFLKDWRTNWATDNKGMIADTK